MCYSNLDYIMKINYKCLLFLFLSLCIITACGSPAIRSATPAIQKGTSPPDLLGETLDGHEIHLSDFSGKIVVLIFWKTWCDACRKELIETKALLHAYQNKFIVYAINIGETPDVVRKFRRLFRISYPVLVDPQAIIISSYGIKAWPTTIIINRQGRVHWTSIGSEVENMRQEIEVLLREENYD
jgi:peroxiredoxin